MLLRVREVNVSHPSNKFHGMYILQYEDRRVIVSESNGRKKSDGMHINKHEGS